MKDAGGCKFCLSIAHKGQPTCPFVGKWRNCEVNGCQEPHSRYLHGCTLQLSFHMQKSHCNSSSAMLLIQKVQTSKNEMTVFWDNGSTIALISKACTNRNQLKGTPVVMDLMTVGNKVTYMNTNLYEVDLVDREGDYHTVHLFEIDDIYDASQIVWTFENL